MRRVNVQNFPKNSRKTGFVSMICDKTSIVASKSTIKPVNNIGQ